MTETLRLEARVNGRPRSVPIAPHHTLLEVLRDDLGLTGSKECCLVGECGACTVLLNGRSVDSCLVLGIEADRGEVITVEGLARDGRLSRLQEAFLEYGAAQCGYCIPGQLVAAQALLAGNPHPTRPEVEEGLAGNLCRCAGYEQIIEAVLGAAEGDGVLGEVAVASGGRAARSEREAGERLDVAATPDARVAPQ